MCLKCIDYLSMEYKLLFYGTETSRYLMEAFQTSFRSNSFPVVMAAVYVLQLVNHVLCRFGFLVVFVPRKMSDLITWMRISISCHYFLLCSMNYFLFNS